MKKDMHIYKELVEALSRLVERTSDIVLMEIKPWPEWVKANKLLKKLNETEMN